MRVAKRLASSLFMLPGKRNVAVDAAMTVETREFVCANVGFSMCSLSVTIRCRAVLSSTTTASALSASRFNVKMEL
jgi:hypothetical protein